MSPDGREAAARGRRAAERVVQIQTRLEGIRDRLGRMGPSGSSADDVAAAAAAAEESIGHALEAQRLDGQAHRRAATAHRRAAEIADKQGEPLRAAEHRRAAELEREQGSG